MADLVSFGCYSFHAVAHIARNMRRADRTELAPFAGDDLALFALRSAGAQQKDAAWFEVVWPIGFVGDPIAFLSVAPAWGSVATANLIATDGWTPRIAAIVADRVRSRVIPHCIGQGLTRVHCFAMSDRPGLARFLTACGARAEARLAGFGGPGMDFDVWAWFAPDQQEEA